MRSTSYHRMGAERRVKLNPRLGGIEHVGHRPRSWLPWALIVVAVLSWWW